MAREYESEGERKKRRANWKIFRESVVDDCEDDRIFLPQKLLAKAFGVSFDTISKWPLKPVAKVGVETLYYLPEVISHRLGGDEEGAQKLNPQQEKAMLDRAKREKAELDLAESRGELVKVDEVCKTLEGELISIRQKMLAIPNRLARTLITLQSPAEMQDVLTQAITEALKELTYDGRIDLENPSHNKTSVETAAQNDPSGMGGHIPGVEPGVIIGAGQVGHKPS